MVPFWLFVFFLNSCQAQEHVADILKRQINFKPPFFQQRSGLEEAFLTRKKVDDTDEEASITELIDSMHDFSQSLLVQMWNDEGDNVVFSPFSLHTVLAMLASSATADSQTQEELLDALGRTRNIQGLEIRYKRLLNEYKHSLVNTLLTFGNRMWMSERFYDNVKHKYVLHLSDTYLTEVSEFKRNSPEREINQWVKEQTKGKIPKIIDSVPNDVVMLLVNALYFKASWTLVFNPVTEPQNFFLSNGETTEVNMMTRTSFAFAASIFRYDVPGLRQIDFLTLAIPYEFENDDGRFEMVLVMPNEPKGLDYLQHYLNRTKEDPSVKNFFDVAFESLQSGRGHKQEREVTMPQFTIKSKLSMVDHLNKIGVEDAFKVGDFDSISTFPTKVSDIKHFATIEVTPDGTVGAAASAIEIVALSANFELPPVLIINKPFLFAVYDRQQGVFLFLGKYTNPDTA